MWQKFKKQQSAVGRTITWYWWVSVYTNVRTYFHVWLLTAHCHGNSLWWCFSGPGQQCVGKRLSQERIESERERKFLVKMVLGIPTDLQGAVKRLYPTNHRTTLAVAQMIHRIVINGSFFWNEPAVLHLILTEHGMAAQCHMKRVLNKIDSSGLHQNQN